MKKLISLIFILSITLADLAFSPGSVVGSDLPATPPTPPVVDECNSFDNLIRNFNFECGKENWKFFSSVGGNNWNVNVFNGSDGNAVLVRINKTADNLQLYQKDISLEPNTEYSLRFRAKSNRNRNIKVYLHSHDGPYTNYGLNGFGANLSTTWQEYFVDFKTSGFSEPADDGRLRFWFTNNSKVGDKIWVDNVVLVKI